MISSTTVPAMVKLLQELQNLRHSLVYIMDCRNGRVPQATVAITIEGRGCAFSREADQPDDYNLILAAAALIIRRRISLAEAQLAAFGVTAEDPAHKVQS